MLFHDLILKIRQDISTIDPAVVTAIAEEWQDFMQNVSRRYQQAQTKKLELSIQELLYQDYGRFLQREYFFKNHFLNNEVGSGFLYRDFLRLEWSALGRPLADLECDDNPANDDKRRPCPDQPTIIEQWYSFLYNSNAMETGTLYYEAEFFHHRLQSIIQPEKNCQALVDSAMYYFSKSHGDIEFERFFQSEVYIARKILQYLNKDLREHRELYRQTKSRIKHIAQRIIAAVQQYRESLLKHHLAIEIKLKKELAQKQKELETKHRAIMRNLQMARQIQHGFLPQKKPDNPKIETAYIYQPIEEVGGDFFDWVDLPKQKTGFAIFDVAGHGAAAALLSSFAKIIFDQATRQNLSAGPTLEYINKALLGKTHSFFITMFYAIYDAKQKKLIYSNGGHNYPILFKKDSIVHLKAQGKVLGLFDSASIKEESVSVETGDRLVLFTDGIVESFSPQGELYGEDRFMDFLLQNRNVAGQELTGLLKKNLIDFAGTPGFDDDITLLIVDFK